MNGFLVVMGIISAFAGGLLVGLGLRAMGDYLQSTWQGVGLTLTGAVMIIAGLLLAGSSSGLLIL